MFFNFNFTKPKIYDKERYKKYLINKSYKKSQIIFKNYSKSYYLGGHFFEYNKFKQVCSLYSFLRIIDNVIDSNNTIEFKKKKLYDFQNKFLKAYEEYNNYNSLEVLSNYEWYEYKDHILGIFHTFYNLNVNIILINKFFKSMEMDLYKYEYNNFKELLGYMDGSACIVGEIMYLIMNQCNHENDKNMNNYARNLGIAFQMTNFIRDYEEDFEMKPKRIYFPIEEQNIFRIDLNNYDNTYEDCNQKDFFKFQIDKTKNYYIEAYKGITKLNNKYKKGIYLSWKMGVGILEKIEKNNYDLSKYNNLSKLEKIKIVFQIFNLIEIIKLFLNYLLYNYIYFYT